MRSAAVLRSVPRNRYSRNGVVLELFAWRPGVRAPPTQDLDVGLRNHMAAGQLTAMLLKSLKPSTRLNQRLPMAAQRFLVQQAAPQNLLQLARASRSHFHTTQAPSYVGASRSGLLRRTFASTPEPVTTATTLSVSSDADEPLVTDAPNFDAAAAEAQPSVVEVVSVTTEPPPQAATPEEPLLQPEPAASSEAVVSADPSLSNFLQSWKVYTEALATQGFFRDEVFDLSSTEVEQYGIVKRANLNMARERPDLLYSLPEAKIVNLISQPLPYSERKVSAHWQTDCCCVLCLCYESCSGPVVSSEAPISCAVVCAYS